MPLIDMPLAQLETYQGRNPRPADFDAYWDAALAEMRQVTPEVEFRPAAFQTPHVDCFDLFFTGVGGARIHCKFLRPHSAGTKVPAVCMFHGYSGHSGDWADKLAYAGAGFVVAAMDCRGQGGLSEDLTPVRGTTHSGHIIRGLEDPDPRRLLFRSIFLDTAQLAGLIMALPEVDPSRVYATGGSQGGGLTLACAALEPRLARIAVAFPFLCDYQRVWEMDLAKDAYHELRNFFRNHDPCHQRQREIFTRLGYIDCQHLAPRIRAKTMLAVGLMDTICPPSTQFAAYNKLVCPKSRRIYPDFTHEHLPGWNDEIFQFFRGN